MDKTTMSDEKKVEAYIQKHEKWQSQLLAMRDILNSSILSETVKWGSPTYTLDKKILISLVGFKNHCAIWFHQGVFLEDKELVLVNAQQGTTKGMRQLRFEEGDKIPKRIIKNFVTQTIANHRAGKKIAPEKKTLVVPSELDSALRNDRKLKAAFEALTPGKQREYADHISSAKQEKTRVSRMEKASALIIRGVGLHDKYKNC